MSGSISPPASSLLSNTLSGLLVALVAGCGGGGSGAPAATSNPPAITAQPASQTVLTDATATFAVAATGSALSYQWHRNGLAIGGVPVWVAAAARPQSATLSTSTQYRVYFELNGNVYTGALIKDGVVLGGSYWVSNPGGATATDRLTFLPYQIRMNKAARDSIAADMAI